ncbi:MAG: hypothetical protein AAF725_25275, partial [Acidobacteriota bacterium]
PMLLTAASNHRRGEEPSYLGRRWLRNLEDLIPLHQGYVEIVRRVAADTEAPLCDLAARFEALGKEERDRSFSADGIHLTPHGDRLLADALDACLEREGLWPALLQGSGPDGGDGSEARGAG